MTRKLLIFFAACVAVSLVSISIANWIGLPDEDQFKKALIIRENGNWEWSSHDDDTTAQVDRSALLTKIYVWNGTDDLTFKIPAKVNYVKAATPSLTIVASENLHKLMTVESGTLDLNGAYRATNSKHTPTITISGPSVPKLKIDSVAEVQLDALDQNELDIEVHGAADVQASGRVQTLNVNISGAGAGDFEKLQAQDVKAELNGAGSVDLRGSGNVDVAIRGAGSVTLHQKPAHLKTSIFGVGSVDKDY